MLSFIYNTRSTDKEDRTEKNCPTQKNDNTRMYWVTRIFTLK